MTSRNVPLLLLTAPVRAEALYFVFFAALDVQEGLKHAVVDGLREFDSGECANVARNAESSGLHCLKYNNSGKIIGKLTLYQQTHVLA